MRTGPQVSWDNRPFLERMGRVHLYRACNHFGVPYKQGAPATEMRDSIRVHNITDDQLMRFIDCEVVTGKDEHGNVHQEVYPKVEPHESARLQAEGQAIDYEKIIAERAAEVAEKDKQLEAQDSTLEVLMARLEALEANSLPLSKMSPPQLKGIAKRRGLDYTGLKTKDELIALLEG